MAIDLKTKLHKGCKTCPAYTARPEYSPCERCAMGTPNGGRKSK